MRLKVKLGLPALTVIIPTRNRAVTLEAALRTCVSQDYDRLHILVSDNVSSDHTMDIVRSFKDPRVQYVNTHQGMSMTRNWEFALSHVDRGYVTFLGDDDGLVPNAATDIASLIQETGTPAISWNKAEYHWPNHPNARIRNVLLIPSMNVMLEMSSALALRHATHFWLPYNKLPTVYNSFVAYDAIASARRTGGRFFMSVTPDVYSGFALMKVLRSYLYSSRPFSVNGASALSNGAVAIYGGKLEGEAVRFMSEMDVAQNEMFQVIPGAIYSSIAEALLQANKYCFDSRLKINKKLLIKLILRDIYRFLPERRPQSLEELYRMVAPYGLKKFAEECSIVMARTRFAGDPLLGEIQMRGAIEKGNLVVDANRFEVKDIHDACTLVGNLLPPYRLPSFIHAYSLFTLVLTAKCTDFSLYAGWKDMLYYLSQMKNFATSLFGKMPLLGGRVCQDQFLS